MSSTGEARVISPRPCRSTQPHLLASFGLTESELGYVAGIIDGEGCISFGVDAVGQGRWQVEVHNCSEVLLAWLHERLRGSVGSWRARTPRHRPAATWSLNGQAAVALCSELQPYLVIKREHAELLVESYALRRGGGSGVRRSLPIANVAERRRLAARFRELNQRGAR